MKKWVTVFAAFAVLHIGGWVGAHAWLTASPTTVLVVVDTSYSMKPHFPAMAEWLRQHDANAHYQKVIVGTDKANLGELRKLKSASVIFRTSFGRMSIDALKKYDRVNATQKLLLSDGAVEPDGWTVIEFR